MSGIDFLFEPDYESQTRVLDDTHEDMIQTGNQEYFDPDAMPTRWIYEFQGMGKQIGHILISYSVLDACQSPKKGSGYTPNPDNDLISDHKLLIVSLTFRSD